MKNGLIGALVGGIILFVWQFLSWSMLNIHGSTMSYTPQQDAIMDCINSQNIEAGTYFLPGASPEATMEEKEALYAASMGKPWAYLHYQKNLQMTMGSNMVRGFVVNVLAVFLLCWILMGNPSLTFQKVFLSSLFVGLIGYFTVSYLGAIWFDFNSLPDLIDAVVQWSLVGAWLGWFLTRKGATTSAGILNN